MGLNFKNVVIENLRGDEKLLIVDIDKLEDFKEDGKLKALFFINQEKIVRSHIMVFSNKNAKHDDLITSFFNYSFNPDSYSGKLALYNLFQDIQFFNIIENGKLIANGNINGSKDRATNGRTKGCIDWYLITTYYYSNGTKRTTEEYLFTTCDDECNTTRVAGRIKCGGGGGGGGTIGSGPMFPGSPQNGDIYEFRDQEGKLTRYRFNSEINGWSIVYVILPEILIQSQPQTYPYLLTDSGPFHGFSVLGPDNLFYTFDAYLGGWLASPDVQNEIETPCLHNQVESIRNSDVQSTIQEIFNDVFDNTSGNNMYRFTESYNPPYPARTYLESANPLQLRTDLNRTLLLNASLEYTTIVIYHEIVHAILYNQGQQGSLHHSEILHNYIDELATSAISLFPNLSLTDARAIAMFGLGDIANSNPSVNNQVASQFGLSTNQISEIGTSYRRDNTQGNVKKGTPCN